MEYCGRSFLALQWNIFKLLLRMISSPTVITFSAVQISVLPSSWKGQFLKLVRRFFSKLILESSGSPSSPRLRSAILNYTAKIVFFFLTVYRTSLLDASSVSLKYWCFTFWTRIKYIYNLRKYIQNMKKLLFSNFSAFFIKL